MAETEEHLHLKAMAHSIARSLGWEAETEASAPDGSWTADVLATKNGSRIAIEVQWSGQTNEDTMRRQARYQAAGIAGVWLLRRPGFLVSNDLPAACIGGDIADGFAALLPYTRRMRAQDRSDPSRWHQTLPMQTFLEAVFSERLKFGVPEGCPAEVRVYARDVACWHDSCRARTRVVTEITVTYGPNTHELSLRELGAHREVCEEMIRNLRYSPFRGKLASRVSNARGKERYIAYGCVRCDRLIGDHYVGRTQLDEIDAQFTVRLSGNWKAVVSPPFHPKCWSVYPEL